MSKKTYNYSVDPSRIYRYNKFLSTLDQKNNTILKQNNTNILENTPETEIKKQLEEIIEKINEKFKQNNYSSTQFTGQTNNDIIMTNINIIDPNLSDDITNKYNKKVDKYLHLFKSEIKPVIKKNVTIEMEINSITDILKIINTYKLDPTIQYNINMKALHNIKEPLEELNNMIGMEQLKTNIVYQILYFIQDLHKSKVGNGDFLHTVIYGPPGTGKTEIAKLMGKIYSKLGVLSKGTFKKVTRSDLIAGYLGQTALKTRDIIKEALGGVLFIDEAYALGNPDKKDSFAKECIDTLCEALSDNKENLMVIIAGYEMELKECFFNYNQGLDSRFTWRFKTDEYTAEDLHRIFLKKVKDIGWEIQENSNIKADWFKKNKEYMIFYGRDIETILSKTKIAHSKRVFCKPISEKKKINVIDLDKGFEMYLKNEDVKNRKDANIFKKYLYETLYS
jgi:SpoVK/Ycf46/Vps4 family AAA+-type ATPase